MSSSLRSGLIRLAFENPKLRKDLLPLLKEAGCEKLPEGGMRDNCEKKKEEGDDKKASAPEQFGNKTLKDAKKGWAEVMKALSDAEGGLGFGYQAAEAKKLIEDMIEDLQDLQQRL